MIGTRLGGIDHVAQWRAMQSAVDAARTLPAEADRWKHRAARFDRALRNREADATLDALAALVTVGDTVMDVGAGTGRHALPLAARCARVIAVEPSEAMRAQLEARRARERADNVTVLPSPWPLETPPRAELVFSSHVLYAVDDIEPFLRAMSAAARRRCALLLGLRPPSSVLDPLWSAVHGRDRPPRPAALEAFAVLHQLGYEASFRVLADTARELTYGTEPDDLSELCHRLGLPDDDAHRARVADALAQRCPRDAQDRYRAGLTPPTALLEWAAD